MSEQAKFRWTYLIERYDFDEKQIIDISNDFPNLVNELCDNGETILHRLCSRNCMSLIHHVLMLGADPNVKNRYGLTSLDTVVIRNNTRNLTEMLLNFGAKLSGDNMVFNRINLYVVDLLIAQDLITFDTKIGPWQLPALSYALEVRCNYCVNQLLLMGCNTIAYTCGISAIEYELMILKKDESIKLLDEQFIFPIHLINSHAQYYDDIAFVIILMYEFIP
jgi:hypothetical protein